MTVTLCPNSQRRNVSYWTRLTTKKKMRDACLGPCHRRLSKGVHTSCIHSHWWRNTGGEKTPVALSFILRASMRNLPQNLKISQCYISKSASICSVLRSCLLTLFWLVLSCTTSPKSQLASSSVSKYVYRLLFKTYYLSKQFSSPQLAPQITAQFLNWRLPIFFAKVVFSFPLQSTVFCFSKYWAPIEQYFR